MPAKRCIIKVAQLKHIYCLGGSENMMEENNAVEICGLSKSYGGNKALDNISFSVRRGEIMGFLGPNGAGKSTTMNILTGCISASQGSVTVCGCDVLENPKIVKGKIGYLPEQPPLYFDMTVYEYLSFVYDLKKVKNDKKAHIEHVMELVQISDMQGRMIKNLSKGYKQRVGLAQALIGDPEVLVLDEPTVGLDPKQIVEIRNVIKAIGKERTIILSTHILQEVSAVCDRVTIIAHGRIVAENTIEGLEELAGGKDKFRVRVLGGKADARSVIEAVPNVVSVVNEPQAESGTAEFVVTQESGSDIRKDLFDALSRAGMPIYGLRPAGLTLEEIFIKLTSQPVIPETPAETEQDSAEASDAEMSSAEEITETADNEAAEETEGLGDERDI